VVRFLLWLLILLLLGPAAIILAYRFLPVPITPLMLIRAPSEHTIEHSWVADEAISRHLKRAVIAAEDARFCQHRGFDWGAIQDAWDEYQSGEREVLRGASTITQQTAKNLLLWPGGGFVRKALEAYPTVLLELLWPKRRILETYLNIIEWGPGIYGAEAAARAHFGHTAAKLSEREAALLAAVLPNPRRWSAAAPTEHIQRRASRIQARMAAAPSGCD
jgi:monofunctional glycosyltransferase